MSTYIWTNIGPANCLLPYGTKLISASILTSYLRRIMAFIWQQYRLPKLLFCIMSLKIEHLKLRLILQGANESIGRGYSNNFVRSPVWDYLLSSRDCHSTCNKNKIQNSGRFFPWNGFGCISYYLSFPLHEMHLNNFISADEIREEYVMHRS